MKLIFSFTATLAAFLLGCFLARTCSSQSRMIVSPLVTPSRSIEIVSAKKGLLYGIRTTGRACGDGYVQMYELPSGEMIFEGSEAYNSFKEANPGMRKWLRKSTHIVARVSCPVASDKPKSDRVVASFPKDEFGPVETVIYPIW